MKLLFTGTSLIAQILLIFSVFVQSVCAKNLALDSWHTEQPFQADVVEVSNLANLKLYLYDQRKQPYLKFSALKQNLAQECVDLQFAMNAGMFQPDYSPVGLYVENGRELRALNRRTQGYGNFLLQPNGVLAWNNQQAKILTTDQYAQSDFSALYATQSGPMLVIQGKINSLFLPDASSAKIRNGVGIKNGQLYFVISREPVTFYQFASFFLNVLSVQQALYLDGSVSSLYSAQLQRSEAGRALGPMVGYGIQSLQRPCRN